MFVVLSYQTLTVYIRHESRNGVDGVCQWVHTSLVPKPSPSRFCLTALVKIRRKIWKDFYMLLLCHWKLRSSQSGIFLVRHLMH